VHSTADITVHPIPADPSPTSRVRGGPWCSRRRLAQLLGLLWLLDGALQLQPFMFTTGFARQVIAPAASGQPPFVARAVEWNAHLLAAHPAAFDLAFAVVQLALGAAFLVPRTRRLAVVGSVGWALGVWYLGEGLGGLGGGHAVPLVGAPGAALLYAVLAVAAWPTPDPTAPPPRWTVGAWAALWFGFAGLTLLPGNGTRALGAQLVANADSVPGVLRAADLRLGHLIGGGVVPVGALAAVEIAVGILVLRPGTLRTLALWTGSALVLAEWIFGQSLGQLWSGQATDPNTGPLVILLAVSVAAASGYRVGSGEQIAHGGPAAPVAVTASARSGAPALTGAPAVGR
jgi:hypothetical protein